MIKRQVIDNFLSSEDFNFISSVAMNKDVDRPLPYYPRNTVSHPDDSDVQGPWNWMAISLLYGNHRIWHPFFEELEKTLLLNIKKEIYDYRAIIRVKANFYGWTEKVLTHRFHDDFTFDNVGAILSLNTCDGFTEFEDGEIVNSVANRLLVFNAQDMHRSSTTSTDYGRYNININLV